MDRTMVRASAHSKYVNISYVDFSYVHWLVLP